VLLVFQSRDHQKPPVLRNISVDTRPSGSHIKGANRKPNKATEVFPLLHIPDPNFLITKLKRAIVSQFQSNYLPALIGKGGMESPAAIG
jgi:hypothetical protein